MSTFTRNEIKKSFLKLLNQKPLKQISVKDIAEDCGINRNSFYYHFQDIPSLIEEIVTEEATALITSYPTIDSIEQCINVAINFALENKRAALHIFNSVNRDIFEKYLMNVCSYVVTCYIDTIFQSKPLAEADRDTIIRFYKYACFGAMIEWMSKEILIFRTLK